MEDDGIPPPLAGLAWPYCLEGLVFSPILETRLWENNVLKLNSKLAKIEEGRHPYCTRPFQRDHFWILFTPNYGMYCLFSLEISIWVVGLFDEDFTRGQSSNVRSLSLLNYFVLYQEGISSL